MDDIKKINECPDCASTNIVHGLMRDQVICRDCGLIFAPLAPALKKPAIKPVKMSGKAKKSKNKAKHAKKKPAKKKPVKKAARKKK